MEKKIISGARLMYVEPKNDGEAGYFYILAFFTDGTCRSFWPSTIERVLGQKGQLAFRQMMNDNDFLAFTDAEIEYNVVVKDEKEQTIINSIVFNDEFGLLDILAKKFVASMI